MKEWLLGHFGRVTSSGHYIPEIDGLRLLAILLVLGHHVVAGYLEQTHRLGTQQLPRDWSLIYYRSSLVGWALNLAIGVPLFCVISGFVLSLPFAANYLTGAPRPSRKIYLLRRLVRLEPPYFLNLIFLFLVIVTPWRQADPAAYFHWNFKLLAPHLVASLAYLHAAIYSQPSWINGIAWTLEIEVQFYLLLPLFAELFRIRPTILRRAILISMLLASALVTHYWIEPSGWARLNLTLAIQLHYFLAGLLLADIYLEPPRNLTLRPIVLDLIALLNFVLFVYVLHWKTSLAWLEPLLIAGFYFGVLFGKWASWPFRLRIVTLLGGMSYTVFLYHFFIVRKLLPLTVRLLPPVHALWFGATMQFLVLLVPVFGISAALFLMTERPFMTLSKEISRRSRSGLL